MKALTQILVGGLLLLGMEGAAGCVLDQAHIATVPPDTFQVLATFRCGGLICWERYIVVDGKRLGDGRVCENAAGDKLVDPSKEN